MSEKGVGLMALGFKRQRSARGPENALRTLTARDGLLRQGECDKLRVADLSFVHDTGGQRQCALALGVVRRGERTKTGVRQGVCLLDPLTIELLEAHVAGREPHAKVFALTTAQSFRRDWNELTGKLQLPTRPPHALRHSGAAEAVRRGWTLPDVKVRGRWRSDASVRRYTKTHDLVAYDAEIGKNEALWKLASSWTEDAAGVWARA